MRARMGNHPRAKAPESDMCPSGKGILNLRQEYMYEDLFGIVHTNKIGM